ncbi:MAG: XTP/dITP diphosphatase [Deltaproteobacteria bacterium]|nr:XTP/dITP diphosphatase [Deltaproteobacteria bacterium]
MLPSPPAAAAPRRLVMATRNPNKVRELQHLLADLAVEVLSLADRPDVPEVVEDGDTFAANAVKKASAVAAATRLPALADDSGLEVEALHGQPGVQSARYAGAGHDDAANNHKLLAALAGVPPTRRTARFRCAIALADPTGRPGAAVEVREGTCEGVILDAPRGQNGFGYDPLFLYPELGRTFAELTLEEKSRLSHRARALSAMLPVLREYLGG